MIYRPSTDADRVAIADVHTAAFAADEGPVIVELVEALLHDPTAKPRLSLVAQGAERVVGHVMFSGVSLHSNAIGIARCKPHRILAPLAVHPDFQKRGVGSGLIRTGLERLRADGVELVFVLGDPNYYTRFGFEPALPYRYLAPYTLPDAYAQAWMVQALQPDILGQKPGTLSCATALMHEHLWM